MCRSTAIQRGAGLSDAACLLLASPGDPAQACSSAFAPEVHELPAAWANLTAQTIIPATNLTVHEAVLRPTLNGGHSRSSVEADLVESQLWQGLGKVLQEHISAAAPSACALVIGIAPPWLLSTWDHAGAKGWWEATRMGYSKAASQVPPRAIVADASALPPAVATSVLKTLGWWSMPPVPQMPAQTSRALATEAAAADGRAADAQSVGPTGAPDTVAVAEDPTDAATAGLKALALVPSAMLWPAAEADLWPMYRSLAVLAALVGARSVYVPPAMLKFTWRARALLRLFTPLVQMWRMRICISNLHLKAGDRGERVLLCSHHIAARQWGARTASRLPSNLARAAGRVPVWPAIDCTVPWTEKHPDAVARDPWLQRATRSLPAGVHPNTSGSAASLCT